MQQIVYLYEPFYFVTDTVYPTSAFLGKHIL